MSFRPDWLIYSCCTLEDGGLHCSAPCIFFSVPNSSISFVLKGRGTVATGRIEQGCIKVGEEVEILGLHQVCVNQFFVLCDAALCSLCVSLADDLLCSCSMSGTLVIRLYRTLNLGGIDP